MPLGRAISPLVRTATTTAACPPAVLRVGDALRERRRFTEADVAAYAAVSGDRNPVHLDDGAAREAGGFERGRVVHGMLVASLFPSTIAARFVRAPSPSPSPSLAFRRTLSGHSRRGLVVWLQPGAVYASQTLKFASPVHVGDEVVALVQALLIRRTTAAAASSSTASRYV
jgi:acyl dehydratase